MGDDLVSRVLIQGEFEEAESLLRRAMSITESALGDMHPSFFNSILDLLGLLSKQVSAEILLLCWTHCGGSRGHASVRPLLD